MGGAAVRDRARIAFVAYAVALAVVLLNPSPYLGGSAVTAVTDAAEWAGLPSWLAQWSRIEFLLNVAAMAPMCLIGMLAWPTTRWQQWTAACFVLSVLAEGAQVLLLSSRTGGVTDVVGNTAGACIGALSVALWRRRAGSVRRGRAAPATDRPS